MIGTSCRLLGIEWVVIDTDGLNFVKQCSNYHHGNKILKHLVNSHFKLNYILVAIWISIFQMSFIKRLIRLDTRTPKSSNQRFSRQNNHLVSSTELYNYDIHGDHKCTYCEFQFVVFSQPPENALHISILLK